MSYIIDVNMPKSIAIGKQGENNVETFIIDYSKWFADYGDGTVDVLIQRPKDTAPYLLPTTKIDDTRCCSFTITSVELQQVVKAEIQIRYTVNDKIKKSSVFNVYIAESLDDEIDAPSEWQTYIDYITELEYKAIEAGKSSPKIIDDNWWLFDYELQEYVDSGIKAVGKDGASTTIWNQIVEKGTKIAEIKINNVSQDVFIPLEGSGAQFDEIVLYNGTKITSPVTKNTWSLSSSFGSLPKGIYYLTVLARLTSANSIDCRGYFFVDGKRLSRTTNYFNDTRYTQFNGVIKVESDGMPLQMYVMNPSTSCTLEITSAYAVKIGDVIDD